MMIRSREKHERWPSHPGARYLGAIQGHGKSLCSIRFLCHNRLDLRISQMRNPDAQQTAMALDSGHHTTMDTSEVRAILSIIQENAIHTTSDVRRASANSMSSE
jgi:hypothetical protein